MKKKSNIKILHIILVFLVGAIFGMQSENSDQSLDSNRVFAKNFELQHKKIKKNLQREIDHPESTLPQINSNQEKFPILFYLENYLLTKDSLNIYCAGTENTEFAQIAKELQSNKKVELQSSPNKNSIDLILAPHTLYDTIERIFQASEKLILNDDITTLQEHPFYSYFEALHKDGIFAATLKSGPDIQDFTTLLLNQHELDFSQGHLAESIKMKLFNNVETFFRCFEIFKNAYQKLTGKMLQCNPSYSLTHTPLKEFCRQYISNNPELKKANSQLLDKIITLISIFEIDDEIINLDITLVMKIDESMPSQAADSFKPILITLESDKAQLSNDISVGQHNLDRQIQNLSGSEISMPYIKDADGRVQFKALEHLLNRERLNILEIGGGRGETNAIFNALNTPETSLTVLNAEPHAPFAETYLKAHQLIGTDHVDVVQKTAQELSVQDVTQHFKGKVDAIFASHSFYFILGDLHKATHALINGDMQHLNDHPLHKYLDMLKDDGVLIVTMQTGAGGRLFRNALLGNHGLEVSFDDSLDPGRTLLRSFGNIATFLRHFEFFAKQYEQRTNKKVTAKMHASVANVPLGNLKIKQDSETGGYIIEGDTDSVEAKMMDFYGNWKELQTLATLTLKRAEKMSLSDLNQLGITDLNENLIQEKRNLAIKTQETFLHILRVFAPGLKNMQHPNITLEIKVEK